MNTRTLQITVIALLAALPALRVLAQQPAAPVAADAAANPPAATAPVAGAIADTAQGTATKSRDAAGRDTLSVDFPDEDIRNILRNVADLFELNIIMPDTLQGKTTIKLRDVTWRQIFQSVLAPVNYTYVEDGNIIKIISNDSLLQEPVSTDVFLINYARAADILPTVNSLVDAAAGGRIVVDARSNSLVITERPSRMNRIRPIIEQLDRATDQVMIESKFVEVASSDVKNIGVNWASLANYQINAGNLGGDFTRSRALDRTQGFRRDDQTTRIGQNQTTTTTLNTINNGQTGGSTNTSTVTSSGGALTSTSTTGTNNGLTNSNTVVNTDGTNNTNTDGVNNLFSNLGSLLLTDGTARTMNAVFSASDFSIVLSALQSLQKTKVISNPTIVTLNNTQAMINVGQERPIPNYTYNSERGVYEVSGFTYRPIGVILKVTPQVNSRGFIKLSVEPEVSQSSRDANFQGASIPIVESRKANTTVSLKDGFTMGIGGLVQSNAVNGSNKVPVLGSIPLVGRLFRSDARNIESTNLIIFITAKTISAEGATVEQVFNSERVRELDLKREDLPGYRDGSNPFITTPPTAQK
jgi:type II secretory pathway component GspD/PulD (secretin)